MQNVTLDVIYQELKKLEWMVHTVDKKVENFMGTEAVSKTETARLGKISRSMKTKSKPFFQLARELGV